MKALKFASGCAFGIGDGGDYGDCGYGGGTERCGGDPCGCEPCCQPCCQQYYAGEAAWWGIDRDVQDQFVDGPLTTNFRYYGMINYAGLEYDENAGAQERQRFLQLSGAGHRPRCETRACPTRADQLLRQNLELNIFRLPLSMVAGCGCDCCPEPFSLTGFCGVRYFSF